MRGTSLSWPLVLVTPVLALWIAAFGSACKRTGGDAPNGKELFTVSCARCHGATGGGGLALWEGGPSPRDFRSRAFQQSVTDEQIKQTIVNGKGAAMPPFGKSFSDAQLAALVAQIRSFEEGRQR